MADIIIRARNYQAKVIEMDEYFTYECSQGAWCGLPIKETSDIRDLIEDADWHVTRHDDELVDRVNSNWAPK
jgi:hypothetical protein